MKIMKMKFFHEEIICWNVGVELIDIFLTIGPPPPADVVDVDS